MKQKKTDKKKIEIWPFIGYGVPIALLLFFMLLTELKDVGQFIKFLLYDVITVNFFGVICFTCGLFVFSYGAYMVISKKAVNPKGVILPTIFLTVLFLAIGYGLTKGGRDDFADVGNYLIGNVNEEHVVIKEFRVDVTPERLFYRYTFEDGRTFIERYKGKGFSSVREGDSYYIRYLPRTKKILRIEPS